MIRPMRPDDAAEVQRVFACSFPPHLQRLMIYGQHGLSSYLKDLVDHPTLFPEFKLFVFADVKGLGYAEFRIAGDRGFLSNIFVDAELRSQGVASRLIAHFLSECPQVVALGLDVFESNEGAMRLYQKLGFIRQHSRTWYVRPLDRDSAAAPPAAPQSQGLEARGLISSVAMQARYGFSEYQTESGVRFGRIGDTVLRCLQAEDAENPDILRAVGQHFPEMTEALYISPEPLKSPWQQVDVSWRMEINPQHTVRGRV